MSVAVHAGSGSFGRDESAPVINSGRSAAKDKDTPGLRPGPRPSLQRSRQRRHASAALVVSYGSAVARPPQGDATPAAGVQGGTTCLARPPPARPCCARPTDGGADQALL